MPTLDLWVRVRRVRKLHRVVGMSVWESERYRTFAAHCVRCAQDVSNPAQKLVLLDIAQGWIALANKIEKVTGPKPRVPLRFLIRRSASSTSTLVADLANSGVPSSTNVVQYRHTLARV